jgi:hypothetical protein
MKCGNADCILNENGRCAEPYVDSKNGIDICKGYKKVDKNVIN